MSNLMPFIFGGILLYTFCYTVWLSGAIPPVKISNMKKIIMVILTVCGISAYFIQQEFDVSVVTSPRTPSKEYYYEKAEEYFGDAKTAHAIGQNIVACGRGKTAVEYAISTHDIEFVQPMQDFLNIACIEDEDQ